MDEAQGIDNKLAAEIREEIDRDAPELANYFMTSEIRRITRFSYGRIHHALRKGKRHPLHGVKRGDRWFVNMLDVLEWAEGVSRQQQARWTSNADRLARLTAKAKRELGMVVPDVRSSTNNVPEGRRSYSLDEAAARLDVARNTIGVMMAKGQALADVERWTVGLTKRYDADAIDAYATRREREAAQRVEAKRLREQERDQRREQRDQAREERRNTPKQPRTPAKSQIPEGQRVYDIAGVAITLKTTTVTAYTYCSGSGPLAHIARWRGPHNRKYYDADAVDAFARDGRHFDRVVPNRKYDTPNISDIRDHRVA